METTVVVGMVVAVAMVILIFLVLAVFFTFPVCLKYKTRSKLEEGRPASVVIDTATYLLTVSLPDKVIEVVNLYM